jgi:hypothetical protein
MLKQIPEALSRGILLLEMLLFGFVLHLANSILPLRI